MYVPRMITNQLKIGAFEIWIYDDGHCEIFSSTMMRIVPMAVNHIEIYVLSKEEKSD